MSPQGYEPPTEAEWPKEEVTVIKLGSDPQTIGLRKEVTKNGMPYKQTVWLTVVQVRGLTIQTTF